ncbi:MAG: hypothetical protein N7Q72_06920, partial [Spiroplasma sp. Tabriz.8]|nr:hypothetical protein [Spiroplasma sp. Tabriz.8]
YDVFNRFYLHILNWVHTYFYIYIYTFKYDVFNRFNLHTLLLLLLLLLLYNISSYILNDVLI